MKLFKKVERKKVKYVGNDDGELDADAVVEGLALDAVESSVIQLLSKDGVALNNNVELVVVLGEGGVAGAFDGHLVLLASGRD